MITRNLLNTIVYRRGLQSYSCLSFISHRSLVHQSHQHRNCNNRTTKQETNWLNCYPLRKSLYTSVRNLNTSKKLMAGEDNASKLTVHFKRKNGEVISGTGKVGENLLDVVVNNNLDLDGFGACEGTLACSTCHLILKQEDYDALKNPPTDEELDMLDLAYGLTDTSRLGCQIYLTKEMNRLEVDIPEGVNDQRTDP